MTTQEHVNSYNNEIEPSAPEAERSAAKKLQRIIAIGMLGASLVISGCGGGNSDAKSPNNVAVSGEVEPSIPNEAKDFVAKYGSRYADPVSTYYAEKAYEKNPTSALPKNYLYQEDYDAYAKEHKGDSLIMTDDYINKYRTPHTFYSVSPHGFVWYEISLDEAPNEETAIKVFNEYTKPSLDNYMNLIAKNPTPAGIAIIDEEFKNYCSDTGSFQHDDDGIVKLMDGAKAVVEKYGSAANYSVATAAESSVRDGDNNPKNTAFPVGIEPMVGSMIWNGQPIKEFDESGVCLVINIDQYNKKEVSHTKEIIDGVQLCIFEQPITGSLDEAKSTRVSIGRSI